MSALGAGERLTGNRPTAEDVLGPLETGLGDESEVAWLSACQARPDLGPQPPRVRGLLGAHTIAAADGRLLLSYWRSRRFCDAAAIVWDRHTGSPPLWQGPVDRTHNPRRNPLRPRSVADGVIKGAAVIGAVTVILGAWEALFARVHVRLEVPVEVVNVTAGAPFEFTVPLTNASPVDADLSIHAEAPDGVEVKLGVPVRVRARATGEAIKVRGRARSQAEAPLLLHLRGVARAAGYNPTEAAVDASIALRVYPSTTSRRQRPLPAAKPWCRVALLLDVGRPYPTGLRCQAVLVGGARFMALESGNKPLASQDKSSSLLEWRTPPLPAHATHGEVALYAPPGGAGCAQGGSVPGLSWTCR